MTREALALIALITAGLKAKGYRYLAQIDEADKAIVIRIYKGLDES